MKTDARLMEMLTGYAAAHQHPINIAVHLVGIPIIMFGVFVALSWASFDVANFTVNGAQLATLILFVFYLTLDKLFSLVFLACAAPITYFAMVIGAEPLAISGTVAAGAFVGGYAAQFIGHAIEKSAPVILRHPIQANLAAPFFTVVEIFKIFGWRENLFDEIQIRIEALRTEQHPA
jgi:uncharacterized membrane protein YGL010W